MAACSICSHEAQEELEEVALEAVQGRISWREAARRAGLNHHQGLKNHMERHFQAPPSPTELAVETLDEDIARAIEELRAQMRLAPIEVKPFYAVAIQNLQGLHRTQPSQQHLINALKAIHEVTGMKLEQRMMLDFARHAFKVEAGRAAAALEEQTGIVDAEIVED